SRTGMSPCYSRLNDCGRDVWPVRLVLAAFIHASFMHLGKCACRGYICFYKTMKSLESMRTTPVVRVSPIHTSNAGQSAAIISNRGHGLLPLF
ncbi:MAG TPA: hypothetical protein PLI90_02680, partial [Rhodocyclaceae bacterium]|nr:hypothetical protein [Rhodocyclaceae bacterium]